MEKRRRTNVGTQLPKGRTAESELCNFHFEGKRGPDHCSLVEILPGVSVDGFVGRSA